MKKLLLIGILFLLSSSTLFAARGIVLVLEAPLLLKPDIEAPISMFVRKGEKIFIHDKNAGLSLNDVQYDLTTRNVTYDQGPSGKLFLQSVDSQGRAVWIEKRFVKLIYKDDREFTESISPFKKDPKDFLKFFNLKVFSYL